MHDGENCFKHYIFIVKSSLYITQQPHTNDLLEASSTIKSYLLCIDEDFYPHYGRNLQKRKKKKQSRQENKKKRSKKHFFN